MIPLRFAARSSQPEPFVMRLNAEVRAYELDRTGLRTEFDGDLVEVAGQRLTYASPRGTLVIEGTTAEEVDGDVVLALPGGRAAQRLIRATSPHNTFLITERCDQLCLMCSQPPKHHHADLLPFFEAAALLAPAGMTIGISGGEPLLYKAALLPMMQRVLTHRPDLGFHVLSNAQHIDEDDLDPLVGMRDRVLWGIPLYAADAATHDRIVGKSGAFLQLMETLPIFARAGASIELRTVIMRENAALLARLASFVIMHLPFINRWALMQLESIGFGRQNWDRLFFDHSTEFTPIADALNIAKARNVEAVLFNFPRCTVPQPYRDRAPSTISDWKRRYLGECSGCQERDICGGFFEWYPEDRGFQRLARI
ncbi:His-Xaa-Ser system radical SAM maturase HxsC [Ancylobacter sonchi]|uniref:His-Xaa-Ser system radical SAM maturase HxsC n=1 Tax=Ancylobacter sonchi TaxID=1937790 RepID=UPI001BD474FA|nr:His-Xaa-Ser system radical SAM maturase HxsC [Ancylobacter sonchi]MBS7533298.1 His-Xaa-Ser system radical SAM maturase HxsC [Ancylobacter sonchi]